MKKDRKVTPFQIRWKEQLGPLDCPYAERWVLNLWLFSIRIHHFMKSEPMEHHHDHAWDFITFILKGGYLDVNPSGNDKLTAGSVRYRKAEHAHSVVLAKNTDCRTFLIAFKPRRKWGFWVNGKLKRPLRYFSKWEYLPCDD